MGVASGPDTSRQGAVSGKGKNKEREVKAERDEIYGKKKFKGWEQEEKESEGVPLRARRVVLTDSRTSPPSREERLPSLAVVVDTFTVSHDTGTFAAAKICTTASEISSPMPSPGMSVTVLFSTGLSCSAKFEED
jgi:hypothetical protein